MDRDKNYLAWIRRLPCLICGNPLHTAPHHLPGKHHASLALKTSDYRTIPLCTTHHCEYHDNGRDTFAGRHNIDYEHCIAELNRIYRERNNNECLDCGKRKHRSHCDRHAENCGYPQ